MEPKPAYLEEVEDEDLDIDAPAADDEEPDQDDLTILEMLEEDGIDLDDGDLDDEEDGSEASAALQHPSSVGAKAARFVAAQRRKLIWFKQRAKNDSDDQLRDETIEEAKQRMREAGELQPEIPDELRRAAPTAFQTKFASYIESIVKDQARITEPDEPIFTSENAVPPIIWAKAASQWIPPAVQAKFLAREEPDLSDIGWDDTEDWAVYWCGLLKALPTQHCHSYIGSATSLSCRKNEKSGAKRRRTAHDSPNCNITAPNMFHSLKVQKFKVDGREIQRPAVWSLLMRIPIQVLHKSTSAQLTTLRLICLLTEAVFHDWLGSYHYRVGSLNASSPWDRPDRIWLGTNSFPPLSKGIPATWSAELTKRRRRLKARQHGKKYRARCLEKDAAGVKKRKTEQSRARAKALRGPNPDPKAQDPANPVSLRRVIKYFEDDPVKFMAHLMKWRGVSAKDQVAIIQADNGPLLDREIVHSVTRVELEHFNRLINKICYDALKASKRKPRDTHWNVGRDVWVPQI
ncbi:hypothetical protein F5883DRAFT_651483 [Diaporthe sp. PMI_573]|nr:hypothetical protein F5883DRAFT_651483 [Diaporthaceae sp. PMI_573]